MEKDTVKVIICTIIFLVCGALIALFALIDIDLSAIKLSSIQGIIEKKENLITLEKNLENAENKYSSTKKTFESTKTEFETAKSKYEAISDETISMIKEATTEENYDIEYMWIKLGNYAAINNLSIVMVEPGGKVEEVVSTEDTKTTTTPTTTPTTPTAATTPSTATPAATTADGAEVPTNQTSIENTSDTLLTVTIEGSYLNMSDFVFEVENDKELRFKLDNIEITYVSGTTIRAKFNVKNVIILK